MTAVLFENISELRTVSALGTLANAAIVADDGRIAWIGPTTQAPAADTRIDLGGRAVLPAGSIPTPTCFSTATARQNSKPAWPDKATRQAELTSQ